VILIGRPSSLLRIGYATKDSEVVEVRSQAQEARDALTEVLREGEECVLESRPSVEVGPGYSTVALQVVWRDEE